MMGLRNCMMVLQLTVRWDCELWDGTGENCEIMCLELWDVPGLLRLVSYEMSPVCCEWYWRSRKL